MAFRKKGNKPLVFEEGKIYEHPYIVINTASRANCIAHRMYTNLPIASLQCCCWWARPLCFNFISSNSAVISFPGCNIVKIE